jgi:hypothetical protein
MTKDISKDMQNLKKTLKLIPEDKQPIAQGIYKELEFMQRTLTILKNQIDDEGPTAMFKQGAQEFLREHPALKGYNTTVQRYSLLYKQLKDLLPDQPQEQNDALIDFLHG